MKPKHPDRDQLGSRARQVLDLLYQRGSLTAAEVLDEVEDLPSYSAARAVLRVLEEKGLARHERRASKYVYHPTVAPRQARRSAVRHVVDTFFLGSTTRAMQALVDLSGGELEESEARELRRLIELAENRAARRSGDEKPTRGRKEKP